ncbi:MAG: KEOPS complex subunit Cgi121 [Methanobacteriaceae archaeon]
MTVNDSIEIIGFKANINNIGDVLATISNISNSACNCTIQLLNADAIASYKHAYHGTIHAINAFARGENLANDLGIEIAIRISAQRQISKAIELLGLKEGPMDLAIIMVNCPDYFIDEINNAFDNTLNNFNRDDSVVNNCSSNDLAEIYKVSSNQLAINSIEDILIEKTTMLIVDI